MVISISLVLVVFAGFILAGLLEQNGLFFFMLLVSSVAIILLLLMPFFIVEESYATRFAVRKTKNPLVRLPRLLQLRRDRKLLTKKVGDEEEFEKLLKKYNLSHPDLYAKVQQAYDDAIDYDITYNYTLAKLFSKIVFSIRQFNGENRPYKAFMLERIFFSFLTGNFIVETLELDELVLDKHLQQELEKYFVLTHRLIVQFLQREKVLDFIRNELVSMLKCLNDMESTIEILDEYTSNKKKQLALEEAAKGIKEHLKKQPLSRSQLTKRKIKHGFKSSKRLTAISAQDNDIVEMRTKAGTYYILKDQLSFVYEEETNRPLKLLTDFELQTKLKVLRNLLIELQEMKDSLDEVEFQILVVENEREQMIIEELLAERKTGVRRKVICTNCSKITSAISRLCKHCNSELPSCAICLKRLGKNELVYECPTCQNLFHKEHLEQWLKQNDFCPVCKKEFRKELRIVKLADYLVEAAR